MEPKTSWELAFQEWTCERAGDPLNADQGHGACAHPHGTIVPGTEFLLLELPDGRVRRYHRDCVPASLREEV